MMLAAAATSRPFVARPASLATAARAPTRPVLPVLKAAAGKADEVRCFVNAEGHLVCERLEPGDYVIKNAPVSEHESGMTMPACSTEHPDDCGTYCYINDEGDIYCEGLASGEYTIETASDDDIEKLVKKAGINPL